MIISEIQINVLFQKLFHPLLLNGTTQILIFQVPLVLVFSKKNLTISSVFICRNYKGIKYLTRLGLGLSHLREHKFKYSFQDTLNPFCSCDLDVKTKTVLNTVNDIDSSLTNTYDSTLTHILLFGKASLDVSANIIILNVTMSYIISTSKFDESLLQYFVIFCYMFISLTLFRILMSFFETIHSYSSSPQVFFYYLLTFFFFFYIQVHLKYLRHLVVVIFCSICLSAPYS